MLRHRLTEEQWKFIADMFGPKSTVWGHFDRWNTDPDEIGTLGRSSGGLTCKIYILCDRHGHPLHFHLTAGQAHEASVFDTLMVGADEQLIDEEGEPIAWPVALAGACLTSAEALDVPVSDS